MHDTDLEDRLRTVLRDEADRLPFRVDVERVEARLAARRTSSSRNVRVGLLAAGIGIVAFGLAGIGLIRQPSQSGVGATPSPTAPAVAPAILPELETPLGEVMVDRATEHRTASDRSSLIDGVVGSVQPALRINFAIVCLGQGVISYHIGHPFEADHVYTSNAPCDGVPVQDGLTAEFEGNREVLVSVHGGAAWHIIVTGQGEGGAVLPTQLEVRVVGSDGHSDGTSVVAHEACTEWRAEVQYGSSCLGPDWPAITEPVLTIRPGDALILDLGRGWNLSSIDVSAASLGDVQAGVASETALPLYSGTPNASELRVPMNLDPGTWLLGASLLGTDSEQRFHADTYVRLEIEE